MVYLKQVLLFVMIGLLIISCSEEFQKDTKYERPEWLEGKVFTQLKSNPSLSTFAECIERVGYDSVINISGSYTVFAPNNEAFNTFFQEHPDYNSVADIPLPILLDIVKYHIVQNPWSKSQLTSLDVYGWIDTLDLNNNKPRGFKRETLLRYEDRKYGVKPKQRSGYMIVDTLESNWHRRVATDSRKYVPIFFKKYFDIYDLSLNDFAFYFERPFESSSDIYFAGSRILGDETFAENGFVYEVDRVVEPLKNAYELLDSEEGGGSYDKFLELVNFFPQFTYNSEKTFDQAGADLGLEVDSLFDLTYPLLAFDITNEKTSPPTGALGLPSNVAIRYHHGVIAPTDEAYDQLVNDYFVGQNRWGSIEGAPTHIKRIIANTHMSSNPIYPTDFTNGFYNGEKDIVFIDESDVVQKEYGSNCTFIGVNKAIIPRAFKSVTGPVYLQSGYSRVMYAIEQSGLLSALKRKDEEYVLFVESDADLAIDSSLFYDNTDASFSAFEISGSNPQQFSFSTSDLRTLILNHVGTSIPKGLAKKEFIKNLAGNYLIFNNETGEVKGTGNTTFGYRGSIITPNYPNQISIDADNGITYEIDNWFSFSSQSIFNKITTTYPQFHNLLNKAGLANLYDYNFISENEFYTIFIPTNEALSASGADTLTVDDLKKFLLMHFIQGDIIFTDGNKPSGYYQTSRIDEKSTEFTTIFTKILINTGIDYIELPDKTDNPYITVNESETSNALTGINLGDGTEPILNIVNNAVIHQIDKAFSFEEMDTD